MKKIVLVFSFLFFILSCTSRSDHVGSLESPAVSDSSENGAFSDKIGDMIANDPGYAQCISSAKLSCGTSFINSYAVNNSSTDVCKQFSDPGLETACVEMVVTETAKKTLDADRCSAIADVEKQARCKQDVVFAQ